LPSPGPVIEVYPPGGVIVGTPVPTPATVPATTEAKPIPKLGIKGQIIANYGMKLLKVKADGLAAKAGLEAGDIIVRIGNASIVSLDAYDNAMATVAPDGHADFLVDDVRKRSQSNRLVVVRVNFEPAEPVVDR
jgi:C-terminal processing protease CtpA/Prc